MPLGFGPLSSGAIGASARLGLASQQVGGVIGQASPTGLSASVFLSTVSVVVKVNIQVSQIAPSGLRLRLGVLGSISSTVPKMTVFTEGFPLTGAVPSGFTAGAQVSGTFVAPPAMSGLLGSGFSGFAPTAYVSLGGATMALGAVGSGDPWVEILPVTAPGWTEIVTQ
jgi:hypothetical protein